MSSDDLLLKGAVAGAKQKGAGKGRGKQPAPAAEGQAALFDAPPERAAAGPARKRRKDP